MTNKVTKRKQKRAVRLEWGTLTRFEVTPVVPPVAKARVPRRSTILISAKPTHSLIDSLPVGLAA
jgi:hypothetical protein